MTSHQTTLEPAKSDLGQVPRSDSILSWTWIGEAVPSEGDERGDTFPLTWCSDGSLLSAAGDPVTGDSESGLDVREFIGTPPQLGMRVLNAMPAFVGWGGDGPKPTGMLAVGDTVYLAAQNVPGRHTQDDAVQNWGHGYDAHVFTSHDGGKSWTPDLETVKEPMFPGRTFAAPAFVNFGQANAGSPDDFAYAISGEGWDNGINATLGRVPLGSVPDRSAWEFLSAWQPNGDPVWSADLAESTPVLTHPGYLGMLDMVFLRSINRYILLGWKNKVKAMPGYGSELVIYESEQPWGPFRVVHHEDPWETAKLNPYNPRLPLKWFDPVGKEGWLLFSGNWEDGGKTPLYRAHARQFRLGVREESMEDDLLAGAQ